MPRPSSRHTRRGPGHAPRGHHTSPALNPTASLRALLQAGQLAAVSLDAGEALDAAADCVERLGALTSGMWQALGHELAVAADRLDQESQQRLDDIERRAQALHVDPNAVLAAGAAAAHLDDHRQTLGELLETADDAARRLAAPEALVGFTASDQVLLDPEVDQPPAAAGDADEEAATVSPVGARIWLYLWPSPLEPVTVTVVPTFGALLDSPSGAAVNTRIDAPQTVLDGLAAAHGLTPDTVPPTLSTLALACWSAHQLDDQAQDLLEPDEDDEAEEDLDAEDPE